ncbi:MAG: hypothetical protein AB7K63_04260 [Vicinamibacterales bacterium]
MKITVYQKPTCSTCRQVFTTMKDAGARAILARPADRVREIL